MTTTNTYLNCCPESVEVTVTQNITNVSTGAIEMYHDYFNGADVVDTGGVLTFTLGHAPLSSGQVNMALNSGVQGESTSGTQRNYTVTGSVVTLHFVPDATDVFHFWYLGLA